jgi:RAB protein geranylgeranyltransferase component A
MLDMEVSALFYGVLTWIVTLFRVDDLTHGFCRVCCVLGGQPT